MAKLRLGSQTLDVSVRPVEPWNSPIDERTNLFIFTLANLAVISAAVTYILVAIGLSWRSGLLRVTAPLPEGAGPTGDNLGAIPAFAADSAVYMELIVPNTPRGRVMHSYHLAARFLATSLEISYQPYFTLRDFLSAIGSVLSSPFAGLTNMAERSLYSTEGVGETDAQRAEDIADTVLGDKS